MRNIIIGLLALNSLHAISSTEFDETLKLADVYLTKYEQKKAVKLTDVKVAAKLFAITANSELERLAQRVGYNDSRILSEAEGTYSKVANMIQRLEKKLPPEHYSELSNLAEDLVGTCKRKYSPMRVPNYPNTFANYDLVQDICELTGRVKKYLSVDNF